MAEACASDPMVQASDSIRLLQHGNMPVVEHGLSLPKVFGIQCILHEDAFAPNLIAYILPATVAALNGLLHGTAYDCMGKPTNQLNLKAHDCMCNLIDQLNLCAYARGRHVWHRCGVRMSKSCLWKCLRRLPSVAQVKPSL